MPATISSPTTFSMDHPIITEAVKAAPPAAIVASSWFYGVHWDHIAYFLTAVYTLGLIAQQAYRFAKWMHIRHQEKRAIRRKKAAFRK